MSRPPAWRHTLDEARRQALVAVDFYNRPGERRSFNDFIVHIHLAWQNLLHADRMRRDESIFYRETTGRKKFVRNPDGSKKTWDLSQCLKFEFKDGDPIRTNIDFFIGLRNQIEHRFQDFVLAVTAPEAHACIINFEAEVTRRFGTDETLGNELKFPIFVQSLTPAGFEQQRAMRRGLPQRVANYISEFQKSVPDEVRSDERFAYRLLLIPMQGPKTDADLALNYVRQDALGEEDLKQLVGKEGSVIVAEKFRDAVHGDEMLPKAATAAVAARIDFAFTLHDFTTLRKKWEIGPAKSGSRSQMRKSPGFCVYAPAFSQFVYRPKLVDRMVGALQTAEKFEAELGKPASRKDVEP